MKVSEESKFRFFFPFSCVAIIRANRDPIPFIPSAHLPPWKIGCQLGIRHGTRCTTGHELVGFRRAVTTAVACGFAISTDGLHPPDDWDNIEMAIALRKKQARAAEMRGITKQQTAAGGRAAARRPCLEATHGTRRLSPTADSDAAGARC